MQMAAGGGGDVGGGLSRFRSAPATWLDALLDDDLTPEDSLRIGHNNSGGLTQLLAAGTAPSAASGNLARSNSSSAYNISVAAADAAYFDACAGGGGGSGPAHPYASSSLGGGFHRMNSSPAEFLSGNVDSYFSSYFPSNYLGGSPQMEISSPSGKRVRDKHVDLPSPSKFSTTQLKVELSTETGSLMDLDMEKLFEDSVPCRVRAKRGCATHPRSIAERVRRTRISDRIRRLQELVPNMDKQTNTADMLEEAVEYVKRLQQQIEFSLSKMSLKYLAGIDRRSEEMYLLGQELTVKESS